MKRANFPSSKESVDRIINQHELTGQKMTKKELTKKERASLRNYLAGTTSSMEHTSEVSTRVRLIRRALGQHIPLDSPIEKTEKINRLIDKIRSSMDKDGIDAKALREMGAAQFSKQKFASFTGKTIIGRIFGEKLVSNESVNRLAIVLFPENTEEEK